MEYLVQTRSRGSANAKSGRSLGEVSTSGRIFSGILSKFIPASVSCVCLMMGAGVCSADPVKIESNETTQSAFGAASVTITNAVVNTPFTPSTSNIVTRVTLNLAYSKPTAIQPAGADLRYQVAAGKLQAHHISDGMLSTLTRKFATSDGEAKWANLQAGYGRIFPSDSELMKGRNGTSREEKSNIYVKYSRAF